MLVDPFSLTSLLSDAAPAIFISTNLFCICSEVSFGCVLVVWNSFSYLLWIPLAPFFTQLLAAVGALLASHTLVQFSGFPSVSFGIILGRH